MNTSTTATLITTTTALTLADSLIPIISSIETTQMMNTAGRLISPCTSCPSGSCTGCHGEAIRYGGRVMPKSCSTLVT